MQNLSVSNPNFNALNALKHKNTAQFTGITRCFSYLFMPPEAGDTVFRLLFHVF